MKKLHFIGLLTLLVLVLAGCGGGGGGGGNNVRPIHVANIFSNQPTDGDIAFDAVSQVYTINNGPLNLFFGIDDLDPNFPEFRAFLDFPLDGSTGAEVVPADANIVSATLEVFVTEVSFAPLVPTLIDLVPYSISGLRLEDFDSPPLQTQQINLFPSDQGAIVAIDVTPLMQEAQSLGLSDLQLRFVLDLTTDTGFVGLDDQPTVSLTAPQLIVEYVF